MKNCAVLFATALVVLSGCKTKDDNSPVVDGKINDLVHVESGVYYLGDGSQDFAVPAGNYTLDASKTYILRGWVYIADGASITIPAGTVIKGLKSNDIKGSSLIVEQGGRIHATGTPEHPVVFTSDQPAGARKPGDWGGIIICGKARNNQGTMQIEGGPRTVHGGSDDGDSSGELQYVRIEFAGFPFNTDQEINGLTLGSVGSGTKIDHIQVSYSNDDSFEWFGGAVNCSYLVAYHGWDDDFDTDNGFSGKLQFLLGVRHPKIADQSLSNGFESDNNASASLTAPYTTASFCNVTLVGPIGQDPAFVNDAATGTDFNHYINAGSLYPNNGSRVGQFQSGMQIRRNSHLSVANSVVTGYPIGLIVEDDKVAGTEAFATTNHTISNVVFAGYTDNAAEAAYNNTATGALSILGADANKAFKDWSGTWDYGAAKFTGTSGTTSVSHGLALTNDCGVLSLAAMQLNNPVSVNADMSVNPGQNYGPKAGSPLVKASLTVPAGFDAKGNGYMGAFKSDAAADNWMAGWTNFNPQNTPY
ncbi:hypothetical protein FACS1894159_04950 [Bacteroidia bacterium]|nr:hypothetical protein FACS1894159_04950 [Bacteroidia bacterium]